MAKRSIRYLVKRLNQILVLTIGIGLFIGLCFVSLSQADNEESVSAGDEISTTLPSAVMEVLMAPAGVPTNKCLIYEAPPEASSCKAFFPNIDEGVLKNLLHNYTKCLDEQSYYINFSTQPVIELSETLKVYGRTDEPLVIKGLKLVPGESFPKGAPAIAIYGKPVVLKDVHIEGFETGILYSSYDNSKQRLIGGEILGSGESSCAIEACTMKPSIKNTLISGYPEKVSLISN